MGAFITGWGRALPAREVRNEEYARRFGIDEEWIVRRTGITARRIASDEETTTTLAIQAGRRALEVAEVDPGELDEVVVATCTPEFPSMPATGPLVATALGANRCSAFDVSAACAGFMYALRTTQLAIDGGAARKVLVIGADVLSRITDYDDRSCALFADGAGAVLVEHFDAAPGIGPFRLYSDGTGGPLMYTPVDTGLMIMQGREIYRHAVDVMPYAAQEVLDAAGVSIDDIDHVAMHQANLRIIEACAQRLGIAEGQVLTNVAIRGNTSAASIPLLLADAAEDGRLKPGQTVLAVAVGAGLVWGAGLLPWGNPEVLGL